MPPALVLYLPAEQSLHAIVPVNNALYVPAAHDVHWADVLAVNTLPYAPMMQAVHAEVPVVKALYLPAAHTVHAEVPVANAL